MDVNFYYLNDPQVELIKINKSNLKNINSDFSILRNC